MTDGVFSRTIAGELQFHLQGGALSIAKQEFGGRESTEMVRRYAHLVADHPVEYANRLAWPRAFGGTNLAHRRRGKD